MNAVKSDPVEKQGCLLLENMANLNINVDVNGKILLFFPNLIASPFMIGLHAVFYLSAFLCLVAAVASLLRGQRYIHGQDQVARGAVGVGSLPTSTAAESVLQERESAGSAISPRSK